MDKNTFNRTKDDLGVSPEIIPIADNNEPLIALKDARHLGVRPVWELHPHSLEGGLYKRYMRKHPGYRHVCVRQSVVRMLQKAAESLPDNWQLIIVAGHRPPAVQQMLFDYCRKMVRAKYPGLTEKEVDVMTALYVTDPSRKSPPHCCGAAVDVNVSDLTTGKLVNFGVGINTVSKKSHLHDANISNRARQNRLVLLEAMINAGFSSLHSEWWHYSYGDQNWAAFYERDSAIYGTKDFNETTDII